MRPYPRVLPVGDSALTVELGEGIDPRLNARVRALDRSLAQAPVSGLREALPTYRSLLVLYDPRRVGFAELGRLLLERSGVVGTAGPAASLHEIPTRYGGEDGPDLTEVARARSLSETDVIRLHASTDYMAFMLGFTPGFAYLGLLPAALETPRRATPRVRVPAGSVAIAGAQTAIYPVASPGGWHLIGRTSRRLFDPAWEPPARILPGDHVRFVPVGELREEPGLPPPRPVGSPALEVLEAGLLTTVQDGGRSGHRRLGVAGAGPMDGPSLRAANRAVGNPADTAALECVIEGPTVRFLRPMRFAVAGADLDPVLARADLGDWPVPEGRAVLARPGNVLSWRGRRSGCRAYVAFAGGIDVPPLLGSRSTDLAGGFGGFEGRALRAGDLVALGTLASVRPQSTAPPPPSGPAEVRVVLGPQDDHVTAAALKRLLTGPWAVLSTSDRVGCRLAGERLQHHGPAEITTDGMVPGSIQVPPDGQPIVMMADGPTTGGYPKVATVITADLPRLAQLVPGEDRVRFTAVTLEEAQAALGQREA